MFCLSLFHFAVLVMLLKLSKGSFKLNRLCCIAMSLVRILKVSLRSEPRLDT